MAHWMEVHQEAQNGQEDETMMAADLMVYHSVVQLMMLAAMEIVFLPAISHTPSWLVQCRFDHERQ